MWLDSYPNKTRENCQFALLFVCSHILCAFKIKWHSPHNWITIVHHCKCPYSKVDYLLNELKSGKVNFMLAHAFCEWIVIYSAVIKQNPWCVQLAANGKNVPLNYVGVNTFFALKQLTEQRDQRMKIQAPPFCIQSYILMMQLIFYYWNHFHFSVCCNDTNSLNWWLSSKYWQFEIDK